MGICIKNAKCAKAAVRRKHQTKLPRTSKNELKNTFPNTSDLGPSFSIFGANIYEHAIKNHQNTSAEYDCLLALIFGGFESVLGSKLERKIEPRSIKQGIEKTELVYVLPSEGLIKYQQKFSERIKSNFG